MTLPIGSSQAWLPEGMGRTAKAKFKGLLSKNREVNAGLLARHPVHVVLRHVRQVEIDHVARY
jgi:hypothetical protein